MFSCKKSFPLLVYNMCSSLVNTLVLNTVQKCALVLLGSDSWINTLRKPCPSAYAWGLGFPPPSLFKTLCPKIEATGTSSVQKGISTQWLNYYTWHLASSDKTHGGGGLVAKLCLTLVTTWTVANQAPLPWNFPGKNTGVGCHFLLQGILPTQGLNPGLPHCGQILYHWATREVPNPELQSYLCHWFFLWIWRIVLLQMSAIHTSILYILFPSLPKKKKVKN